MNAKSSDLKVSNESDEGEALANDQEASDSAETVTKKVAKRGELPRAAAG